MYRLAVALLTLPALAALAADRVEPITETGLQRIAEGRVAQAQVDHVVAQTEDLVRDYRQLTRTVDGLNTYNQLLQKQVDSQLTELAALRASIQQVAIIERQIVPLLLRMIDTLDGFVQLDVPFLPEERTTRIRKLRAMMGQANVAAPEKLRRVLEAYQVENDYGRTIEAYKGRVTLNGQPREVDFLRIGRIALLYQDGSGTHTGAWDTQARRWQPLPGHLYRREVVRGLRMARNQLAPGLLVVPVAAPRDAP